jgi:hypothetical protein
VIRRRACAVPASGLGPAGGRAPRTFSPGVHADLVDSQRVEEVPTYGNDRLGDIPAHLLVAPELWTIQ